ncbi:hypothetical protein KHA80_21655 [Anaerobacillus sp. HL2]|nr:hypothetical protein KHA80_21655 [Anaerobacillus sp. HL2]
MNKRYSTKKGNKRYNDEMFLFDGHKLKYSLEIGEGKPFLFKRHFKQFYSH